MSKKKPLKDILSSNSKDSNKRSNKDSNKSSNSDSKLMSDINVSLPHDKRIWRQDISASKVHATMLAKVGIISSQESDSIIKGLDQIAKEIAKETDKRDFVFDDSLEDIHMNIESRLHQIIGETAGKLHTARSRNDQVATDMRLYLKKRLISIDGKLKSLQEALLNQAEKHSNTLMPGLTHLQTAQPISLAFHFMAYFETMSRDRDRLKDALKRINFSPLGAAALAGTSHKIDRHFTAEKLGFTAPLNNAMDAVSSRDHFLETLSIITISATNISRLASEVVLWASPFFQFVKVADVFSSFSSIMPQKRNPDGAELVRAKSSKIAGDFIKLTQIMTSLPMAYSKDLQEDKPILFNALDEFELSVKTMARIIALLSVNKEKMFQASSKEEIFATDIADYLVAEGTSFRQAYYAVKQLISISDEKSCSFSEIDNPTLNKINASLNQDIIADLINPEKALARRDSFGGTAPSEVKRQIAKAKKLLSEE